MNRKNALLLLALIWTPLMADRLAAQPADPALEKPAETSATMSPAKEKTRLESRRSQRSYRGFGDLTALGRDAVVKEGETFNDVTVVGGSASIDGTVRGDLTVVMGSVRLGPKAVIKQDLTIVGGGLDADPAADIGRHPTIVGLGLPGFGTNMADSFWVRVPQQWFSKGLFYGRPLPHQFAWSWAAAGLALLIYIVIALLFPRQLQAAVTTLETRPGNSLGAGLLGMLLAPLLLLVLVMTGIGILVVPFLLLAMLGAFVFSKATIYRYAGQQLGGQLGWQFLQAPMLALLVGALLFYALYTIPVIGLLVWCAMVPLGLGAVLLTIFKREPKPVPEVAGVAMAAATAAAPGAVAGSAPGDTGQNPVLLPRVGFWQRFLASTLDLALVGILMLAVLHLHRWFLLAWVIYHLALWTWKGTTIGGIVVGLRIVRTDGQPINFAVALVRLLGSFFSAAVLGLGFFWAGWTLDKQSWHDKIAGTIIVKWPRASGLV